MAYFADEFRKYQKRERLLTGAIVFIAFLTPISFKLLNEIGIPWVFSAALCSLLVLVGLGLHVYRNKVSDKMIRNYESLDVGAILAKKIHRNRSREFVITNTGYNHFYLKCLKTGEQVLVSKSKVREDFDIAN